MGKKNYFLTIDTETTKTERVADFAATISDSKGRIATQCAVLIDGVYTDRATHPLFYDDSSPVDSIWNEQSLDRRYSVYNQMVKNGTRMLATVPAIQSWLFKALATYKPVLTAYNLGFDVDKCAKSGIDLTIFDRRFCLWHASYSLWGKSKHYRQFVLDNHAFNPPTALGNMTYKTNAEIMARFVLGNPSLEDEPHTALEDIVFYELPILNALLKRRSVKQLLTDVEPFNWRAIQVKDMFTPS